MWNRRKLEELARQEDATFADPRWDRLYLAIERYEGTTNEKLVDAGEALRELDAALDAISYDDIKAQLSGTLVDSIFDRIREHKQQRDKARQRQPAQNAAPEPDSEPEPQQ